MSDCQPRDPVVPEARLLRDEEVRRLIAAAQGGDEAARGKLVEHNLRLVMSIARRFAGQGCDVDDLYQIGCIGLLKAIDGFDLSYDVKFSTYAVPRIAGEIKQFLRRDGPVKLGRSLQELSRQIKEAQQRLAGRLHRQPTAQEVAEYVGSSVEQVVMALEASGPLASLDEVVREDDGRPVVLGDVLPGSSDLGAALVQNIVLREALGRLPPRERLIVRRRFLEEKTQAEVARELGVSQAQVSRLENRCLRFLRGFLGETS